jgi:hypothetical protein
MREIPLNEFTPMEPIPLGGGSSQVGGMREIPLDDFIPDNPLDATTADSGGWRETVSDIGRTVLPITGAALGGVIGAGAGVATGLGAPVASPALGVAGGTLGYGIGERGSDILDELLGLRQSGNLSEEAVRTLESLVEGAKFEMGGQALGAVAGKGLQKLADRRVAKEVGAGVEDISGVRGNIQTADTASKQTGIDLFPAQKSLVPTQLERQSFVSQLPAGTQKASAALRTQNKEASKAVDDLLESIATPESVVIGPERFRTASQKALDARKAIRSEKVSPLYNEAYESGAIVDIKPITNMIDDVVKDFPKGGEVANSLLKVKNLIGKGDRNLRQIHNAKLEIDQMIAGFGENSLGNTTKREILAVKEQLLMQMDESSDLYRISRETFTAESPAVNILEDSIIGKIARLDDTQLKNISKRILDPAETNPLVIKNARKVIRDVDPEAWDMIVRSEIERRVGSIKTTGDVGIENIPSQLHRAIFGNEKQSRVLFEALDGEAKRNLKYLEVALRRGKLGRAVGSPTAAREEIKRELRGGIGQAIRNWLGSPIESATGVGSEAAFNLRVKNLTDSLFDQKWQPKMKQIRRMDYNSDRAGRLMTELLISIDKTSNNKEKSNAKR